MNKKLKAAIIGFGPHGKRLLQACKSVHKIEILGIVDLNPQNLESIESPICGFWDSKSLYEAIPGLQVLIIATNGPSHAPIAIEAINQGVKYLMIEKPMACSIQECFQIEELAKANGVRVSIDKHLRYDASINFIRESIQSGKWGKIRTIQMQVPGIGLGCLGTHWLDIANYLFDSFPIKVSGWIDEPKSANPRGSHFIDPGGMVICDYGNESRSVLSQIEDGAGPLTMEIHTTGARIYYDPKNGVLDILERDLTVVPGPGRPPIYNKLEIAADVNVKGDAIGQMSRLLSDLVSEGEMRTEGKFGAIALEIVTAAYLSHERGNIPVCLPLTKPEETTKYFLFT